MTRTVQLTTGAEARLRNESAPAAVVLVNGGSAKAVPGTWSATSELLAAELAPRFPDLAFAEVRYRVKTWNALDSCMADARAALDLVARPSLLVGFSMGGAVSIGVAAHSEATGVLGLAPWIPGRLSLDGLRGKRLDILHGAWDRYLPGIPGVSAASSRRGFDRARALGIEGTYALIGRGLHGAALRRRSGAILRLPRADAWVDGVAERLELFRAGAGTLAEHGVSYETYSRPLMPLIRAVYRLQVRGEEHIPQTGPVIVAGNHESVLDPFLMAAAIPRPIHFLTKSELWRYPVLRWWLDSIETIPVVRGGSDEAAIAAAVAVLEEGEVVGIFPEGGVKRQGPWLRGAARMALATGAPLLPVRFLDAGRAVGRDSFGFPPLAALIGEPIAVERAMPTADLARELTDELQAAVESLGT